MPRIVGIDLGTSTSEVSYINKEGLPEVIPNHLGDYVTPSVVYIDEHDRKIVGLEAKEQTLLNPESTFLEVKRLMGTGEVLTAKGKTYSPKEISSYILKYLTDCAREYLGEEITNAVITVPAYFTDIQRRETVEAGEMAGLKVERIINEPTAASLDYGIMHMEECKHMLVYDLGGGTLDVTVLELFEGVIDVKSSCGNNKLGGKDFDQAIIDHITKKLKKSHNVDITGDLRAILRTKKAAEDCKIALSTEMEHTINLPFLYNKNGQPIGYEETITRDFFHELVHGMIYSTDYQIKTALSDANLSISDIDLLLMVGGSTRIPLVKTFLEGIGFEPKSLLDPDLCVCRGAAIQAGIIDGTQDGVVIVDVCPYSLSTEVLAETIFGMPQTYCDILIPRNTTIPASKDKTYFTSCDDQEAVQVSVYQGESQMPDENTLLNRFLLGGIPPAKAGKEKINISFSYDINGILEVSAKVISTGNQASIKIDVLDDVVDLSDWKSAKDAKKYRAVINKAEKMLKNLDEDELYNLESELNKLKKGIIQGWETEILDAFKEDILELIDLLDEE